MTQDGMQTSIAVEDYFDPATSGLKQLPVTLTNVFELIASIERIVALMAPERTVLADVRGSYVSDSNIFISDSARIEPGVCIIGPAYIGPNVVLRHGAYVRENVIMLDGSLLGHASEAKGSIFFARSQAPHFSYVGDSLLGTHVNLGAGTILSNLPISSHRNPVTGQRSTIMLTRGGKTFDTRLAKLGAVLGDGVQTGCNAVLSPGTLVGPNSWIYPSANVPKGIYPKDCIIKARTPLEVVSKK